jgi:hypothetical protein
LRFGMAERSARLCGSWWPSFWLRVERDAAGRSVATHRGTGGLRCGTGGAKTRKAPERIPEPFHCCASVAGPEIVYADVFTPAIQVWATEATEQ